MAPRSQFPRLTTAADLGALWREIATLNEADPARWPRPEMLRRLTALGVYAMTGRCPPGLVEPAHEVDRLCAELSTTAWDRIMPDARADDWRWGPSRNGEPLTHIGVLLRAARTRTELDAGRAIGVSDLAAVAGVSRSSVLKARLDRDGRIAAKHALEWMENRSKHSGSEKSTRGA